ncbi:glucosaminidase domain-containing protein [Litchfieldia salsa]|nr:glucosaminidase domain-containing protein [Litchfieldia salsa]
MVQKSFVLLISTLLISLSFLSNISIGFASENLETTGSVEESSYYFIHYNGEEQEVVIDEEVSLKLSGWIDEDKSAVSSSVTDSNNQTIETSLQVSEGLNELYITESKSVYYRVTNSDTFSAEKVTPLELNEQLTVVEENDNGTSIEEKSTIDEYGTLIKSKELIYFFIDGIDQKTVITKEEYDSLNTVVEPTTEETTADVEAPATEETESQVEADSTPVQTQSVSATSVPSVVYSTHVQDYGWLPVVSDGKMSGTSGESKRMEAIKISLANSPYTGSVTYSTHVQTHGWLNPVSDGAMSGTSKESKRMEAIKINLTGDISQHYDIYYRVHAQDYGWLGWAKNGQNAGTQGLSKRLEALEIVLVPKGAAAPGSTSKPFVLDPSVSYTTHVQDYGWLSTVSDGKSSGTIGKSKRMEAVKISLKNTPYKGDITYRTHVESYGWMSNVYNGALSGTSGESKRMEAIQINLTGEMAVHYDIYYRAHAQTYGWLDWAKNGQSSGTQGLSKRLEAIEVVIVEKGGAAPGKTNNPLIMDPSVMYTTHVQGNGWLSQVSNGAMSGTLGESKRLEAIKITLKDLPYSGAVSYKTHVETYGWLNPVSNGALSGTYGEGKRLEAIQMNLTGEMAQHYDIYYRVHAQSYGWLDWAKNGQSAGTEAVSKRLEAIEIRLVAKGGNAPGPTAKPFIKPSLISATSTYNITLSEALAMQMKVSPQTDKYRNDPAYVSSQYLQMFNGGAITGSTVNLRTSPTTKATIAATVGKDTLFILLDKNVTGESVSGSTLWYKIKYDNKEMYVHSSLASSSLRVGQVTASTSLSIRAEQNATSHIYGYAKSGSLLHVLAEDSSGWYSIKLGAWRNAKASDVQAYLDPTTFINDEKQRLQFMNLTKSSDVPVGTLDQYLTGKGILAGQGQAFIDAGRIYGINEVYLMAHTLLETGHGKSTLANGVVYNGVKVYNMYGIGAYDSCPLDCGVKRAYEEGWDSPYKAIVGGAAFISDEYLRGNNWYKSVQNTLYEMRWNPEVMSTNKVAGHQYATDIGWAAKQINTMYEVYKMEPYTIYLEFPIYK